MHYWWASHGRNYEQAITEGTLWNSQGPVGEEHGDTVFLKEMRRGDVVFNYFGPYIRAVSVVSEKWQNAPRPEGYEQQLGEGDDGWLVRTTPLAEGLRVHRERAAGITADGEPGPLNAAGKPIHRYISALTDEEGQALLNECGVTAPQTSAGSLRGLPGSAWGADEPDDQTLTTIRLEQAYLRRHLLRGRLKAPCAICGAELPARLLIAGYIKPRSHCSEEERMDYAGCAMLTCALGCDALYEWGYVVVGPEGLIRAGQAAETERIEDAVNRLVGRRCSAFNEQTTKCFAENERLMLAQQP